MTAEVLKYSTPDPDSLELAPGTKHENLEGWIPEMASQQEIFDALEKAFDYRGDITLTLKDGRRIDGYIFDRRTGKSLSDSVIRLYPVNSSEKASIAYADIARLEFSGKDRAAGSIGKPGSSSMSRRRPRARRTSGCILTSWTSGNRRMLVAARIRSQATRYITCKQRQCGSAPVSAGPPSR